jgi:hypothetical protein
MKFVYKEKVNKMNVSKRNVDESKIIGKWDYCFDINLPGCKTGRCAIIIKPG